MSHRSRLGALEKRFGPPKVDLRYVVATQLLAAWWDCGLPDDTEDLEALVAADNAATQVKFDRYLERLAAVMAEVERG